MRKLLLTLLALLVAIFTVQAQSLIPAFKAGDRVALVGDSITHGGHYHSYIWLYYMTRFPDMPLTLMNCGVGGDEAKSILDRWDWDVLRKNPTYITLTFGMNDTGYFGVYDKENALSLSEEKVERSLGYFRRHRRNRHPHRKIHVLPRRRGPPPAGAFPRSANRCRQGSRLGLCGF